MMPYRTPQQQAEHERRMKAGILVAAQALAAWRGGDAPALEAHILRHAGGDRALATLALCILAASLPAAGQGGSPNA